MIKIVTAHNIDDHSDLMESVWRFRYAQFVERLGWKEIARQDGREIDQFDTADAIHLVLQKDKKVVGYTRLLRTSGPHLLSDVYPHIMEGGSWPRERTVYEWTRCISEPETGLFGDIQASHLLITGVLEFCLVAGIKGMIVETHPKLVAWMFETGYRVEPLHGLQHVNGLPVMPVYIGATRAALDQHHQMFGIDRTALAIDDGLPNPVIGQGTLHHLPDLPPRPEQTHPFFPGIDFDVKRRSSGRN
jgi:acyl-homoserine lactone synthase